ncbi:hypothetical protein Acsp06_55160 [Actinomycetospora sp. NBRC 106375]|uniref:hypothetical protein n=1 Tax=Actinomycetospora sp. NBRC 106375 TaxID=3032207 RepID=UPI00249FC79D|nr:hypothetical protein [Actinomycetospora sp. NBRC 106375]GLZ49331.1 hypothetical protein Acsp06_55160 [Actinomycetospora sp. NBRC 106375]
MRLFNVTAVVIVPAVACAVFWIPSPHMAFPIAGLAVNSIYVLAVAAFFRSIDRVLPAVAGRRARRSSPSGGSPSTP